METGEHVSKGGAKDLNDIPYMVVFEDFSHIIITAGQFGQQFPHVRHHAYVAYHARGEKLLDGSVLKGALDQFVDLVCFYQSVFGQGGTPLSDGQALVRDFLDLHRERHTE